MEIRKARLSDSGFILHVLNKVTLDLQNKGIRQWTYPWNPKKIESSIKNNHTYVLLSGQKVIGTFYISNIDELSDLIIEPQSHYLSKIAILPEFQGKNMGSEIINFAFSYTKMLNKTLYLDCWAGNKKLKEYYTYHGLEYIGDFPENDYSISIFKFN